VFRYRAYGLSFVSDVNFPELSSAADNNKASTSDVRVRLNSRSRHVVRPPDIFSVRTSQNGKPWLRFGRLANGFLLRFLRTADFRVSGDGREIVCIRRSSRASSTTVRHLLLDQVLPVVLNLRGQEAIHATAVLVAGAGVAFLGPTGSGKSTLAASFMLAGYRALGDDCMALLANDLVRVIPAYPGFRLWKDSAGALNLDHSRAMPVADRIDKVRMLASECASGFPTRPVPLKRIYRLVRARSYRRKALRTPLIERLKPRDAMIELVRSSFPLDIADKMMLARHFQVMRQVASEVPFSRVMLPDDFTALPAVRDAILSDFAER
jgi:hypothetical protein